MIRQLLLTLSAAPALSDMARPGALQALLGYHTAACTAQGGSLTIAEDAVTRAHLLGPEDPALILDSGKISCSTASAMFCADSIGCELNVFMGEARHGLIVQSWSLVPDGDRQLLQVTIAGELLNRPEPGTCRMTWDRSAAALVDLDAAN